MQATDKSNILALCAVTRLHIASIREAETYHLVDQ